MGKKLVSRYVTLGFDREGDADKFLKMIEGNGLLLQLYKRIKDGDGNTKGQVTNIQARSAHEWTPSHWERRRFEFGGVTIEFKNQVIASEFLYLVMGLISGDFNDASEGPDGTEEELQDVKDSNFHVAATALALLLKPENVFGAKIERD